MRNSYKQPDNLTWAYHEGDNYEVDDVVGRNIKWFRIEQMDKGVIWMQVDDEVFHFYHDKGGRIVLKHSYSNKGLEANGD